MTPRTAAHIRFVLIALSVVALVVAYSFTTATPASASPDFATAWASSSGAIQNQTLDAVAQTYAASWASTGTGSITNLSGFSSLSANTGVCPAASESLCVSQFAGPVKGAGYDFGVASAPNPASGGVLVAEVVIFAVPCSDCAPPPPQTFVSMSATPDSAGYWLAASDGTVVPRGDAVGYGSMAGQHLNAPIISITSTPTGKGYWLMAADGGIFSFGDAAFYGSMGGTHLNQPVVGMSSTPGGHGYWLVASDGGVFAFGDAKFYGSMGGSPLNRPVVALADDPATGGYWEVASDGGVFAFDAPFHGSTGSLTLNKPVVGIEASPSGSGYRMVATDGGIFSFNLPFSGSMGGTPLNSPIVAMAPDGASAYWLLGADGGIFAFGGAGYFGNGTTP